MTQPTSDTIQAVKADTTTIIGLLTEQGDGEGEDRIDKILAALVLLVEETRAMRTELTDLRTELTDLRAGLKPSR